MKNDAAGNDLIANNDVFADILNQCHLVKVSDLLLATMGESQMVEKYIRFL